MILVLFRFLSKIEKRTSWNPLL